MTIAIEIPVWIIQCLKWFSTAVVLGLAALGAGVLWAPSDWRLFK